MQFSLQCSDGGRVIQQVAQSTHRLSSSLAALRNKMKLGPRGIPRRMEPPAVNNGNVTRRHDVIWREMAKFVFLTKDNGAETDAACSEGRQQVRKCGITSYRKKLNSCFAQKTSSSSSSSIPVIH